MGTGAYGDRMGSALRIGPRPTLAAQVLKRAEFAVTRVTCDLPDHGFTHPIPAEDAYIVSLQLRDFEKCELFIDGRAVKHQHSRAGTFTVLDLKTGPYAHLRDPFDSLHFYVPRAALDAIADDEGVSRVDSLRLAAGAPVDDPVISHLGAALLPALERPEQANRLFVEHIALALNVHLAENYADLRKVAARARGGLPTWQMRRITELLMTRLDGDVSLDELARECGLSRSHFARAFKVTTGSPVHRWLLDKRLERAEDLLLRTTLSLSEISTVLGFADQSHFTRAFATRAGATPAVFRRVRRR